ncbi:hypothetical protein [Yinghuangia sp. YIM S09857]|uniref:hypothetical protein n=1 Tax=Yinghuangia sp. YIM S09857 TaxID=3436929 RepID=UPI003F5320FC
MTTDHGGWPERREDGSQPSAPPWYGPTAGRPPGTPPNVPPTVPPNPPPALPPNVLPGPMPGQVPLPGQQTYAPTGYRFPVPPRRASAARTALIAGLGGAVVVVVAAAVILFAVLGGDDDDAKRKDAAPSRSAAATATAPAPAPATSGAAPGTSRPAPVAEPFALPSAVGGVPGVPDHEAAPSVQDITDAFGRDFDEVRTMVYQESRSSAGTLFSTGVMRDVVPVDFVQAFVPASESAVETDMPAGLWRQPGLIRCWNGPRSAVCLWGDDTRMLFGSSTETVADLVSQMEGIYLGNRTDG